MILKYLIKILLLICFSSSCFSQFNHLSKMGTVKKLPMRNAEVYEFDYNSIGDKLISIAPYLAVISNIDSVFSVGDGVLKAVWNFSDTDVEVVIKNGQDKFFVYLNLKSCFLNKGDSILKGSLIGEAKKLENKNDKFGLELQMTNNRGDKIYEDKIWELIKDE